MNQISADIPPNKTARIKYPRPSFVESFCAAEFVELFEVGAGVAFAVEVGIAEGLAVTDFFLDEYFVLVVTPLFVPVAGVVVAEPEELFVDAI